MENFITLDNTNIENEHICCAFSDKKCSEGYQLKKEWLTREFGNGFVFRRLDERAKVFIEYSPAETGWVPVYAPEYLLINCFWVSGKYKGEGYGKKLLQSAIDDAKSQGKNGLVTVAGKKKFHFMSDTKWLLRQGFTITETTPDGFVLLTLKTKPDAPDPVFKNIVLSGAINENDGIVVYYSNRCPFTEYYVNVSLKETVEKRGLPLHIHKFNFAEEAQNSPSPATIFSMYYNGKFITTDVSVCMDSRFDKIVKR